MAYVSVYKINQKKDKMSHIRLLSEMTEEAKELLYFDTSYKEAKKTDNADLSIGLWDEIEFEVIEKHNLGFTDFMYLQDSVIIFSENIMKNTQLALCFFYSGQLIEIRIKSSPHKYFLCNVNDTSNMLDKKNCIFGEKDANDQCDILKYAFRDDRLSSSKPLFKMEPDWSRSIYSVQWPKGESEPDFVRTMKKYKIDVFDYIRLIRF